jgi:hypothetical protein
MLDDTFKNILVVAWRLPPLMEKIIWQRENYKSFVEEFDDTQGVKSQIITMVKRRNNKHWKLKIEQHESHKNLTWLHNNYIDITSRREGIKLTFLVPIDTDRMGGKYHTVETILKSNYKLVETASKWISRTNIYMTAHFTNFKCRS